MAANNPNEAPVPDVIPSVDEDALMAQLDEMMPTGDDEQPQDKPDDGARADQDDDGEPQVDDEAPEDDDEADFSDEDLLSAEDKATLKDQYGDDFVGRLKEDPALDAYVKRALTAARQKDSGKLTTLEQRAALADGFEKLFTENPDLYQEAMKRYGQPAAANTAQRPGTTGQAQTDTPNVAELLGFPEGSESWTLKELEDHYKTQFPKAVDAIVNQRTAAMEAQLAELQDYRRKQDAATWASITDAAMKQLEGAGYKDVGQFRADIEKALVGLNSQGLLVDDNGNALDDLQAWEAAVYAVPKARAHYTKARSSAETTAEADRITKAKTEAKLPKRLKAAGNRKATPESVLAGLRKMKDEGKNIDRSLADNLPGFADDLGL